MALFRSETFAPGSSPVPNLECLRAVFDAHAGQDGKIAREELQEALQASGARLLKQEVAAARDEADRQQFGAPAGSDPDSSEPDEEALEKERLARENRRYDRPYVEALSNRSRFLNQEWQKEDETIEPFNAYQQTHAATMVLADSIGQNGLIDIVNLRYVLTSCGEEMSDDEFDMAIREFGQSSKGMFQLKKLLVAYCDLATKVGRNDSDQCQDVLREMEKNRHQKANAKRQSRILQPGLVSAAALSSSLPASAAQSERDHDED